MLKQWGILPVCLTIIFVGIKAWAAPKDIQICVDVVTRVPFRESQAPKLKKNKKDPPAPKPATLPVTQPSENLNSKMKNLLEEVEEKIPDQEEETADDHGLDDNPKDSTPVKVKQVEETDAILKLQSSANPKESVKYRLPSRYRSLLPLGQSPEAYLQRLIEHFVTHEEGFVAVKTGCKERIRVELYPLADGWSVFASYSGHRREERVDRLFANELSQFAERAVLALLYDKPISATIMRDTVLRADSDKSTQQIHGTHHFLLGLGTQLRGGTFPTASNAGDAPESLRFFSPMTLAAGYRGRFENWGLESIVHLDLSTNKTSIQRNKFGGHVDMGGQFGVNIHFLHYTNPRGVSSFYYGAGGSFDLLWFSAIKAEKLRAGDNRSSLISGGLNVDAVAGFEFMRASTVQFFLQSELNMPAYLVATENEDGTINTWFPGLSFKLGVMF